MIEDRTSEIRYYTRRVEFEGIEPILLERRYSHGGKRYLPDEAQCRWNHGSEVREIDVSGAVLKKDGTPGAFRTDVKYITPSHDRWGRGSIHYNEAPTWLLELLGISSQEASA